MVYNFRTAWLRALPLFLLLSVPPLTLLAQWRPQFSRTPLAGTIQIKDIQEDIWDLQLSHSENELNRIDPEIQKVQEEKTRIKFGNGVKMKSNGTPQNFRFDTPEVKKNFSGINSSAIPFDNGTAISNGKFVVHAVNSSIIIKDTSGQVLFSNSLSSFFGVSTTISDPRVIYDSYADRFIVLAIPTTECKVYIAFSASNDPTGTWYKYLQPIPGEISNYVYDYPYAGVNEHELIISGSVFPPNGSGASVHPHVLQISKREAYKGAPLRVNNYKLPTTSDYSLCVVNHGSPDIPYGPQAYLVSDIRSSLGGTEIVLYTITDTIGNSPELLNTQLLVDHYAPSGYAGQKSTGSVLTTIDTRIMSAVYAQGTIHLVHHGDIDNSGFSSIVYYRLQPDSGTIRSYSFTKSSYDVCFPSVALFSNAPREDKTVLIAFMESSTNIYPSLSAIICNDDGTWSQPIVVKEGSGNIRNFRWGDYSSCTRRHNAPQPTVWISGEYGASGNTRSCWIAELSAKAILSRPDVLIKTPYLLYPNPAADRFMIKMNMPIEEQMNISLYDVLGQLVKVLYDGRLPAGEHELSFNQTALAAGTYIVRLSAGGQVRYTHKLVQY